MRRLKNRSPKTVFKIVLRGRFLKILCRSMSGHLVVIFGIYAEFCGGNWHRELLGPLWGMFSAGLNFWYVRVVSRVDFGVLVVIFGIYAKLCGERWHRELLGPFWGLFSAGQSSEPRRINCKTISAGRRVNCFCPSSYALH